MTPKKYKITYQDYLAACRADALFNEAVKLGEYFYKRAAEANDPLNAESAQEECTMRAISSMFDSIYAAMRIIAKYMPTNTFEREFREEAEKVGYVGGSSPKEQINNETLHAIYQLGCCCEQLEYCIRANRSWLLRNAITMSDIYDRVNIDPVKKVEDRISEDIVSTNKWLEKLGLGPLHLDIPGYSKEIVQKARDKQTMEMMRANEYIDEVWNDQSLHERKKLTTAYLDGMLAADRIKEEGGEE